MEQEESSPATMQRPLTLFDAVANKDHEGMLELYASHSRNSIVSYLSVRSRWSCAMSRSAEPKSEEKLDEYLQHLSYRESPPRPRSPRHSPARDLRPPGGYHRSFMGSKHDADDSAFHSMITGLAEILSTSKEDDAPATATAAPAPEEQPFKKTKKQASHHNAEVDRLAWESATILSNSRPSSSFVVFQRGYESMNSGDEEGEEDGRQPLFDGSVANATPPPLFAAVGTSSAGSGTILHLACALDSPLALAILLTMGAEAGAPHTAFRRLMIHEASCCGSVQCLDLLLNLGKTCAAEFEDEKKMPPTGVSPGSSSYFLRFGGEEYKEHGVADDAGSEESFLSILKGAIDLAKQVRMGQLSEMEAAQALLARAKLPEATRIILARSCYFNLGKDHPLTEPYLSKTPAFVDGHGNSPLHWAAFKNETACVSLLLKFDADPNALAHPSGWTPLHDAAYSDAAESLELLLDNGAQVDATANSGATPLCFAAQEDASRAASILLKHGANLSARCCGQPRNDGGHQVGLPPNHMQQQHHHHGRFSGYTPLHYCAHYNAYRAARVLLTHPSSVLAMEIPDLSERFPIHVAVARGSSDVLRELLRGGARVDTQSALSTSPRSSSSYAASQNTIAFAAPSSPPSQARSAAIPFASSPPRSPNTTNVITPVSSPVLRSMIPSRPVTSSKPWNCLSQRSIDECRDLISAAEGNWTRGRHSLFTPADRRAVVELLRVGKRLEQMGTGIFLDMWPLVLSFCGRGWFPVPETTRLVDVGSRGDESPNHHTFVAASLHQQIRQESVEETSTRTDHDEEELTQFHLDH